MRGPFQKEFLGQCVKLIQAWHFPNPTEKNGESECLKKAGSVKCVCVSVFNKGLLEFCR